MNLPSDWKIKKTGKVTEFVRSNGYDKTTIEMDKESFYFTHATVEFSLDGGHNIFVEFEIPIHVITEVLKDGQNDQ